MGELYNHDENPFAEFGMEGSIPSISVNLPVGETLVVNGPRLVPMVVTISNKAECNPERDARMLSTFLSCSLNDQTVFHLAKYLFAEYLAPLMEDSKGMFNNPVPQKMVPKSSVPKRKPKVNPEDEHKD